MKIRFLHISDLHLTGLKSKNAVDAFNQDVVTHSMIKKIEKLETEIDFIIITGDLTYSGKSDEFDVAEVFCDNLLEVSGIEKNRLFLVPGNHDLDRNEITERHIKRIYPFENQDEINGFFTDPDMYPIVMRKFSNFRNFAMNYLERDLFESKTLSFLENLEIHKVGDKCMINLLGLNSSIFAGYDGDDQRKLALGLYQVEPLTRKLERHDLSIGFFHHPFSCHNKQDQESKNVLNNKLDMILTGHLHEPDNTALFTTAGECVVIGAGAAFETRESENSFNLVEIDTESGRGNVQFYKYLSAHNTWKENTDVNPHRKDGTFSFQFRSMVGGQGDEPEEVSAPISVVDGGLDEEITSYCQKSDALYAHLPVAGFVTQLKVPIDIEEIYVPLRAMLNLSGQGTTFSDAEDAERGLREKDVGHEISLPEAFQEAHKRKRKGLVILGDPGSGKTTHLKLLLLGCIRKGPKELNLPSGMVHVFLPLRDLRDLDHGLDLFIEQQLDSPHLHTPQGFGEKLLKRGNLLFLLDGLDEVADLKQREEVATWILEAIPAHPTCRFVVTCRFAGYSSTVQMSEDFLEMHIRPFNSEEAEKFVRNWYKAVEEGLAKDTEQAGVIAREKAECLLERLKEPDFRTSKVFELTRNPLLLTNICLVHRHRNDLPHKRAKLYEECIDVLLEHWRKAKKLRVRATAQERRRVLQPVALWMHGKDGRTRAKGSELAPIIEPALKAIGSEDLDALDFLKAVRDDSGLLTGWDQENYGFMHLGFQEYLAAREIRSRAFKDKRVLGDLASHFGESWWQEVILIMLALEDPSLFEEFMEEVVQLPAFASYPGLVDMCLEDTAETSIQPFMDILYREPGKDEELWERQAAALRVVKRLDGSALETVKTKLEKHPSPEISQWFKEYSREELAERDVMNAKRGGYELVKIPGGTFMMGSLGTEKDRRESEGPQHKVKVPEFYMGRFPVTNRQYGIFLAENPKVAEPKYWADRRYNQPEQPVVGVSWDNAKKYADWAGLRLPTEAEWEYACRAGTDTRYYLGDDEKDLKRAGWYENNSGGQLHPVGEKEPNGFGLYDMHGNVLEWCEDDWHDTYKGAPGDGSPWIDKPRGSYRVLRGGSWLINARNCRSASRSRDSPDYRYDDAGVRLVLPRSADQESR